MLAAATILLVAAADPAPAPITGRWLTPEGKALVEIRKCGATLCATLVKVLKPGPNAQTPEGAKRIKAMMAKPFVTGIAVSGDYWAGKIVDAKGNSYDAWFRVENGALTMKGCYGVLCKTQIWTRAR